MTKHFAVVGSPIAHSLSPNLHRAGFEYLNVDATYSRFDLKDNLGDFIRERTPQLDGLSVTMPLKDDALAFADELDSVASATGSCNTLVLRDARWHGYNTDVAGLSKAISIVPAGAVLILGSGATSRSALESCRQRGDLITVWSRSTDNLTEMQLRHFDENALSDLSRFTLVISTIPIPAFSEILRLATSNPSFTFSAAYGISTPTLDQARTASEWIDGREMLLWQAVAQQARFAGREPGDFMVNDGLVASMRAALELPVGE